MDLTKLSEKEKLTIFLNIYHIMILHGNLVLGAPQSWYNWPAYFNGISYIINLECITIAELEHCVLRASSSAPSTKLSKFVIPSLKFPSLALKKRDFRINFCLNCGSGSMPSLVPIYDAEHLDRQFDEMTRIYMNGSFEVNETSGTILLPTICLWYSQDFVPSSSLSSSPSLATSLEHCIDVLAAYVDSNTKTKLRRLLEDSVERSGSKCSATNGNFSKSDDADHGGDSSPERGVLGIKNVFDVTKEKIVDTVGSSVCNYQEFEIKFCQFDYRCNNFVEFRELSHPQLDGTVNARSIEML